MPESDRAALGRNCFRVWVTRRSTSRGRIVVEVVLRTFDGICAVVVINPLELRFQLEKARQLYCTKRNQETQIFRLNALMERQWFADVQRLREHSFGRWIGRRRPTIQLLLQDAKVFFNSRTWYRQRGIPYRRGYLLSGRPSCGKTFFARLVAGVYRRRSILDLSSNSNLANESLPVYIQSVDQKVSL